MKEFLMESAFFGVLLSLACYQVGCFLQRKCKSPLCNPLLISILLCIGLLLLLDIPYSSYAAGAQPLSYLLTPATVCLALPLYRQLTVLRQNWPAICAAILAGVLASLGSIYIFSRLFSFDRAQYLSLLPKSITTAIGLGLSQEFGGIPSFTASAIILTGIFGSMIAQGACKLLKITHPVARGLAIGCASHAIGTTKALELGETEGAMSSLAIAVSGLFTALFMSVFAALPL